MSILAKMNNKLQRLESEFDELLKNAPWVGHGGTPHIVDNAKGRKMKKYSDAYNERLRNKNREIEDQKEKIELMESRIAYRNTQTKKSAKFLEKNPIHPDLLKMAEDGKVKQWARNPEFFFINGLNKVAFTTINGKINISARFPAKTQDDYDFALKLVREYKNKDIS